MIGRASLKHEHIKQQLRWSLLIFLFYFFTIQPILNAFYPELAQRYLTIQNIEENGEEEETFEKNRMNEAPWQQHRFPYSLSKPVHQEAGVLQFGRYNSQLCACNAEDVSTPPPEA